MPLDITYTVTFREISFVGGPVDGVKKLIDITNVKDEISVYSKPSIFNTLDCNCIYKLDGNIATFSHDVLD